MSAVLKPEAGQRLHPGAQWPQRSFDRGSFGPVRVPEGHGKFAGGEPEGVMPKLAGSGARRMMRRISCTCSCVQIGDTEGRKTTLNGPFVGTGYHGAVESGMEMSGMFLRFVTQLTQPPSAIIAACSKSPVLFAENPAAASCVEELALAEQLSWFETNMQNRRGFAITSSPCTRDGDLLGQGQRGRACSEVTPTCRSR